MEKIKRFLMIFICIIVAAAFAVMGVACADTEESGTKKAASDETEKAETELVVYYSVKAVGSEEATTKAVLDITTAAVETEETTEESVETPTKPQSNSEFIDKNSSYDSADETWWISEEEICDYTRRGKKITFYDAFDNEIVVNASCEFLANGEEDGEVYAKVVDISTGDVKETPGVYKLNSITKRTKSQVEEAIAVKQREAIEYGYQDFYDGEDSGSGTISYIEEETTTYETDTYVTETDIEESSEEETEESETDETITEETETDETEEPTEPVETEEPETGETEEPETEETEEPTEPIETVETETIAG